MGKNSNKNCEEDERLKVKDAKIKHLKTFKATACEVDAKNVKAGVITVADDVLYQGTSLNNYLVQPLTSYNIGFDALADSGIFGDRTPVKPDGVNQQVWDAMLESVKVSVIPQLAARFRKGRERLQLPQVLDDIDIAGTITLQPFFQSFPGDVAKKDMIQIWTNIGWNLEVSNMALRLSQPNVPLSNFTGSVSGNILTVTDLSNGLVSQGMYLSGDGVPADTLILDQLTKDPPDGPFLEKGTYLLDRSFNIPSTALQGTFPQGPRVCSIYIHYGYIEKATGLVKVKLLDLGNRQFEPTIDFDPNDDLNCTQSWGEKYAGFRAVPGIVTQTMMNEMTNPDGSLNPNNTGAIQLVILRETGILTYFPGGCDNPDSRSIQTQVTNPNCVTNCAGNANATSSVSTTVGVEF